ncbi:MAG: hypothetical protein LC734_06065 [Acidobacteria bacterium]|nr:hypothetical protein [Acidobacteriota bacterium]
MANQQNQFPKRETTGENPIINRGGRDNPQTLDASRTSGQGGTAAAPARTLIDTAKDTAGQAYDAVTERAATTLDEKKTTVSKGLTSVADGIKTLGDNLGGQRADNPLAGAVAGYSDTAARSVQNVASYFEQKDARQMMRDVESFARRNPALFVGAAFGIGLLAARFLKSSQPSHHAPQTNLRSDLERGGTRENFGDLKSGHGVRIQDEGFEGNRPTTAASTSGAGTGRSTIGLADESDFTTGTPAGDITSKGGAGRKKPADTTGRSGSTGGSINDPM